MGQNRSRNAARYGALAEQVAFRRYGLEPERDEWHDARGPDGDPWDVKACMLNREVPRFRLWQEQHDELRGNGGGYVFLGYVPVGRGIRVKNSRSVRASDLSVSFYGAGDHPKGRQVKVPPSAVLKQG